MRKKPDFKSINKLVVAASFAAIMGYLLNIANTLKGQFVFLGISIPYPIIVIIVFTVLILLGLRIIEVTWDKIFPVRKEFRELIADGDSLLLKSHQSSQYKSNRQSK